MEITDRLKSFPVLGRYSRNIQTDPDPKYAKIGFNIELSAKAKTPPQQPTDRKYPNEGLVMIDKIEAIKIFQAWMVLVTEIDG